MPVRFSKKMAPAWIRLNGIDLNHVDGQEWVCVQIYVNKEHEVARSLGRKSIAFYFPILISHNMNVDKAENHLLRPLFEGYIFCRIHAKFISRLENMQHIIRVLRTPAQKQFLGEIRAIQRQRQDVSFNPPRDRELEVEIGTVIELTMGPFAGYRGKVSNIRPSGIVSIDLQGPSKNFEIKIDSLSLSRHLSATEYRPLNPQSIHEFNFLEERKEELEPSSTKELSDLVRELQRKTRIDLRDISSALVEHFKKNPDLIHDLEHRKFEEFVAHLLGDMGAEVELTPGSHDKGRDILAVFQLPIGKVLTIVECKKYAENRPVGVDVVRSFLFTVNETDRASNGLIATTSRFTSGARAMEKDYQWKLGLRDFAGIQEWISNYGQWKIQSGTGLWFPENRLL